VVVVVDGVRDDVGLGDDVRVEVSVVVVVVEGVRVGDEVGLRVPEGVAVRVCVDVSDSDTEPDPDKLWVRVSVSDDLGEWLADTEPL